jgi:hypothetical protein
VVSWNGMKYLSTSSTRESVRTGRPVCRTFASMPASSCRANVHRCVWCSGNTRRFHSRAGSILTTTCAVVEEDEEHLGLGSALSRAAVRLQVVEALGSTRHGVSRRQCQTRNRTNSGDGILAIIVFQPNSFRQASNYQAYRMAFVAEAIRAPCNYRYTVQMRRRVVSWQGVAS